MTDPADSTLPSSTEVDPNEAPESREAPETSSAPEADAVSDVSGAVASDAVRAEGDEVRAEGDDDASDDDAGGDEPSEDEGAEGDEAAASEGGEGEGKKKRRRRRRKKKKGAEGESAGEGQAQAAPAEPRRKDAPHLPFQKLFEGAARRHAFSVGEVVAGRVAEVRDEVAVVDLFGKALAYARRCEPRDIPVGPFHDEEAEAAEAAAESQEAPAQEAPTGEAPTGEAPAVEAAEAAVTEAAPETPVVEAPVAEAPVAEVAIAEAPVADAEASSDTEPAEADEPEGDASESERPPASSEPVAEPGYVLAPEGVAPIEAGGIFRGRVGAVAESGHIAIVNELIDVKTTRAYLRHARDARGRVPGLVFGFNRGGFDVLVHGLRAFCPVSGLTAEHVDDPATLLGQWAEFHVQAAKSGVQGLVVSRRSILEKEARKRAKAFLKSLEPGQTVKGRVTQVREFGLFVDIGGVEGLLHQSELSWERGVRPADVAQVGDEIDVQVLNVHERESKRERHDRISLSIKSLQPDPWRAAVADLVEGQPRKGKVVRTTEFGAFVQLAPGVDGLLHITELGRELKHADQAVQVGDELHVVVERIDKKARRISLSRLSPEDAEAFEKGELSLESAAPRLKVGAALKVRVTQVGAAGLSVQVDNIVGKRGRGFIPNAEMGTARGTDHRRQWPPGTEIDVVVIGTDRDGGLRLSRKRFLQDEERKAVREYRKEVSKQGLGTFGDILRQKLGIDQEGTQ